MNEETLTQDAELEQQDSDGLEEPQPSENEDAVEAPQDEPALPIEPPPAEASEQDVTYWKSQAKKYERLLKKGETTPAPAPSATAGEYVTKAEFYKQNEAKAIQSARANPEIADNWKDIIAFFPANADRSTPEAVEQAIYDAHALWKRRQEPKESEDTTVKARLSTSTGKGGTSPAATPAKRTSYIQKQQPYSEWFT